MDDGEEKSLCPEGNQLIARTRWKLLAKVWFFWNRILILAHRSEFECCCRFYRRRALRMANRVLSLPQLPQDNCTAFSSGMFWNQTCFGKTIVVSGCNAVHSTTRIFLSTLGNVYFIQLIEPLNKLLIVIFRFLINQFSIDELTGFNNTGNVCK